MSNSVKPENLQKSIREYLENYAEDIYESVVKTTDEITEEAVAELKQKSPRRKGSRKKPYYKGWRKQQEKQNKGKYVIKIHNKTNYQLTHLLEFEHATKKGKKTKAIPHVRPIEKKYKEKYEKSITTVIRRRSKK